MHIWRESVYVRKVTWSLRNCLWLFRTLVVRIAAFQIRLNESCLKSVLKNSCPKSTTWLVKYSRADLKSFLNLTFLDGLWTSFPTFLWLIAHPLTALTQPCGGGINSVSVQRNLLVCGPDASRSRSHSLQTLSWRPITLTSQLTHKESFEQSVFDENPVGLSSPNARVNSVIADRHVYSILYGLSEDYVE